MISARFALLAALVSASLEHAVPGAARRQLSTPPEGFAAVSAAPQDETITFRISLPQKNFRGLENALYAASTPGSPQYGQYLTKDQVKEYASPADDAVASVSAWLASHGLSPSSLSPSGDWISVQATVAQANALLQAKFTVYEGQGMDTPVIRTLSYSLPPQVQDHIVAIHPTTTFPVAADRAREDSTVTQGSANTESTLSRRQEGSAIPPSCARPSLEELENWDPAADLRSYGLTCKMDMYGIPYAPLTVPAQGNSLWISGFNNMFASRNETRRQLDTWRPDFNGGRGMFDVVTITGGLNNQLEHSIWQVAYVSGAMTIAPNTPVTLMSVGTDSSADYIVWLLDQANYVLELEEPPKVLVITSAAIGTEAFVDPALARSLCNSYAQLSARGVTVLVPVHTGSAWGPGPTCPMFDVSFPGSCPYVTSVGGSLPSFNANEPWEQAESNLGGFSNFFDRPAYQDDVVGQYLETMEEDIYQGRWNPAGRATPDISMNEYWAGAPDTGRGYSTTSFAASHLGGIIALLNEELLTAGKPTLGFINPLIYQHLDAFRDIVHGSNGPACGTPGFSATVGWDPVSGVGSPFYPKLREIAGL